MRRALPWISVGLSAILALGSAGALVVAAGQAEPARRALRGSVGATQAERAVVRAQESVSGTDIPAALAAIRRANEAAGRVALLTQEMVGSLEPTVDETARAVGSARDGASSAAAARSETRIAAQLLAAIAGYQTAASDSAGVTNAALRRVLAALRETNRSFSGPGP